MVRGRAAVPVHHLTWTLAALLALLGLSLAQDASQTGAPPLDLSALASLASNPQIINMVSTLFQNNNNNNNQKPPVGATATTGQSPQDQFGIQDQDPNSIAPQLAPAEPAPPPADAANAQQVDQLRKRPPGSGSSVTTATANAGPTLQQQKGAGNPLAGIMAMLPGIGGLGGLLNRVTVAPAGKPEAASTGANSSNGSNAQSVINQVLIAYASGQIPNELIQLGLSGKVPPQMVELALSGQVPPQLIQMIITGQVPMSTINAFLAAMQPPGASSTATNTPPTSQPSSSTSSLAKLLNLPATTRNFIDALLNRPRGSGDSTSINLPTLLGPVPVNLPVPNVRRFGQIVGGTISNVASMIPF